MSNLHKKYNGDYPKLPDLSEGMKGYRVFANQRSAVIYEGTDKDVARLIRNIGRHQLVPAGERMEDMP